MLEKNNTMYTYILNYINILSFCLICEVKLKFFFFFWGLKQSGFSPLFVRPFRMDPSPKKKGPLCCEPAPKECEMDTYYLDL